MKRQYEVEMTCTVTIEVDDEVTSEHYPGETVLTAHLNRERFIEGSTLETALGALAQEVGVDNRSVSRIDGWADFPDEMARSVGYPHFSVDSVTELVRA